MNLTVEVAYRMSGKIEVPSFLDAFHVEYYIGITSNVLPKE